MNQKAEWCKAMAVCLLYSLAFYVSYEFLVVIKRELWLQESSGFMFPLSICNFLFKWMLKIALKIEKMSAEDSLKYWITWRGNSDNLRMFDICF